MRTDLAAGLATALLAGPWERAAMERRCRQAVGRSATPRWMRQLVAEVLSYHHRPPQDASRELTALLVRLPAWSSGRRSRTRLRIVAWHPVPTTMRAPSSLTSAWPVTPLDDVDALAKLLDLTTGELAWLADVRSIEREAPAHLRHYRVVTRAKRGGGVRVLEVPKPRLREAQRRLLRHVVAPIPVHQAGHGGVRGRSVATALAPHAGHGEILRLDLASFFGSVGAGRIWGVLRAAGYPEAVAHAITGLTTTAISRAAWAEVPVDAASGPAAADLRVAHRRLGRELSWPHLPQGAPTSPGLANLVAYSLDVRLSGLAASLRCAYTRYVDDLIFSAPDLPGALLRRRVPQIVAEEGFAVAAGKTVLLSRASRQQVLGAVVNERTTVGRREYDNLRATVHNCRMRGAASQAGDRSIEAFHDHLTGRVAWVNGLDAQRGRRLRAGLESIDWSR